MQTFPDVSSKYLAISLPINPDKVSIEGWLSWLSMKDATAFGPYDPTLTDLDHIFSIGSKFCQEAQAIQSGKMTLNELDYANGFYPLC